MRRQIRAELFKFRTTNLRWVFTFAIVVSTAAVLAVNCFNAHSLLKPLTQYLALHSHGHVDSIPDEHTARLTTEWNLGHSTVTQAANLFTSGQLIGVLLACLLGIVLVTSEFQQQTATSTFLLNPRRTTVILAKLVAATVLSASAWAISTLMCLVAGTIFLHEEGYGSQLDHWSVLRAVLLNLAAYLVWTVFGIGFGSLIRNQLGATVSVTVLYLIGAAAAGTIFDLLSTYVFNSDAVLSWEVIMPAVASAVMISPTKTYLQSPDQWVGAAVLIAYSVFFGIVGISSLRRRDIA